MKISHISPLFLALSLLLAFTTSAFAQQVIIAVSKQVHLDKKEQARFKDRKSIIFKEQFIKQFQQSYLNYVTALGENADVRFVKEFSKDNVNFILRLSAVGAKFQEANEGDNNADDPDLNGVYYIYIGWQLHDPHTNTIAAVLRPWETKIFSRNGKLSTDEIFFEIWKRFLNEGVAHANADVLSSEIKQKKLLNSSTSINYQTDSGKNPKANGKQTGNVRVSLGTNLITGEAINNPITNFKLTAKKGIFTKTGTHEIEFTGADYLHSQYGGQRHFETGYQAYDCKDYKQREEKVYDEFELSLIQLLVENRDDSLKVTREDFECEPGLYDIHFDFHGPGYANVKGIYHKVLIRFPKEGEKIPELYIPTTQQELQELAMQEGEDIPQVDKNGNPIEAPPFSYTIEGLGTTTVYSGNDEELPEISIQNLNPLFSGFKNDPALPNLCSIQQLGNGPITFEFYIRLIEMVQGHEFDQGGFHTLSTADHTALHGGVASLNSKYPVIFPEPVFTLELIEKFQNYEEVEMEVTNSGGGTLKFNFKPAEEDSVKNPQPSQSQDSGDSQSPSTDTKSEQTQDNKPSKNESQHKNTEANVQFEQMLNAIGGKGTAEEAMRQMKSISDQVDEAFSQAEKEISQEVDINAAIKLIENEKDRWENMPYSEFEKTVSEMNPGFSKKEIKEAYNQMHAEDGKQETIVPADNEMSEFQKQMWAIETLNNPQNKSELAKALRILDPNVSDEKIDDSWHKVQKYRKK